MVLRIDVRVSLDSGLLWGRDNSIVSKLTLHSINLNDTSVKSERLFAGDKFAKLTTSGVESPKAFVCPKISGWDPLLLRLIH